MKAGRHLKVHGRPLTKMERLFALNCYVSGVKVLAIAAQLNCTESAVCKIAARAGVPGRKKRKQ
jgi:hypothetical protein